VPKYPSEVYFIAQHIFNVDHSSKVENLTNQKALKCKHDSPSRDWL